MGSALQSFKTDPDQSVIVGRNGTVKIAEVQVIETTAGGVWIDGVNPRGKVINGGLFITGQAMDEICRWWLNRKFPMGIKRVVESGELVREHADTETLMAEIGELLDCACSQEIVGCPIFQADDGRYYRVFVEAVIDEISEEDAVYGLEEGEAVGSS